VSSLNASRAEQEARIRQEILDYLSGHPHAMDSLEGIATWWLPRHEARIDIGLVARALEALQVNGWLERVGDAERPLFRRRAGSGGAHPSQE
jgi:Arc/MetJ family transcription regulator